MLFLRKPCDLFKWIETIPNVERWICVRLNVFLSFEVFDIKLRLESKYFRRVRTSLIKSVFILRISSSITI